MEMERREFLQAGLGIVAGLVLNPMEILAKPGLERKYELGARKKLEDRYELKEIQSFKIYLPRALRFYGDDIVVFNEDETKRFRLDNGKCREIDRIVVADKMPQAYSIKVLASTMYGLDYSLYPSLCFADIDGDGIVDMLSAEQYSNCADLAKFFFYKGDGDGSFAKTSELKGTNELVKSDGTVVKSPYSGPGPCFSVFTDETGTYYAAGRLRSRPLFLATVLGQEVTFGKYNRETSEFDYWGVLEDRNEPKVLSFGPAVLWTDNGKKLFTAGSGGLSEWDMTKDMENKRFVATNRKKYKRNGADLVYVEIDGISSVFAIETGRLNMFQKTGDCYEEVGIKNRVGGSLIDARVVEGRTIVITDEDRVNKIHVYEVVPIAKKTSFFSD